MALTSYFNWESNLQTDLNLGASFFHETTPEEEVLVAPDYYYYNYNNNHHLFLPYYRNSLDPNMSHLDPYSNFLYPHELVPYDPFMYERHYDSLLPRPKRQKCLSYDQNLMMDLLAPMNDSFLDVNNVVVPKVPEFYYDEVAVLGNGEESTVAAVVDEGGRKKNQKTLPPPVVSAQSVAARERRRRITEKTQELGKMVPGGSKMNTADMLHAAAKYVNYLKAQVSMLQLVDTLKADNKVFTANEEMQNLLTSPAVEEKMYMEEKCFVPKEFVINLTNHKDIQSIPSILKDLNQFISTDTGIEEQCP